MLFISIVVKEASSFLEDLLALVNSKRYHILFSLRDRAVLDSVEQPFVISFLRLHRSLCILQSFSHIYAARDTVDILLEDGERSM